MTTAATIATAVLRGLVLGLSWGSSYEPLRADAFRFA
jgi:hypothetical protein